MFDVLTHEKGASVLRMLEQHLGPTVFRDGVRHHLTAHAYGNAETTDLWVSLGQASKHDVPALMNGGFFSPGYPVLSLSVESSSTLTAAQHRFTYAEDTSMSSSPSVAPHWQIPIQLRIDTGQGTETRRLLLGDREISISRCLRSGRRFWQNEGGHGFYRVATARNCWPLTDARLARSIRSSDLISLNDTWASTVAGMVAPADHLALTEHFSLGAEIRMSGPSCWARFPRCIGCWRKTIARAPLVRKRLATTFADLGWTPRADERNWSGVTRGYHSSLGHTGAR